MSPERMENKRLRHPLIWAAAVLVLLLFSFLAVRSGGPGRGQGEEQPVFEVREGLLTISVTESGTIQPREQVILKSEVEGQTTILYLVPEGREVRKGELLIELDASSLADQKVDQQIKVQNAEAAFIRARENLAVVKNQAESDIDEAELDADFARQDLQKYTEGEFPQEVREAEAEIALSEEEMRRAEDELKWSKVLYGEKYLSQTELQADELAYEKARLDLELALSELDLLKDFTHKRKLAELQSDVKQSAMALERTRRSSAADIVQAEADLRAKSSEYERQKDKLNKIEEQIARTKIYAPMDGLVVHSTSARANWRGNNEPLAEGQIVRERQELIYLPTTSAYKAEIKVHESSLDKIKTGLPVRLEVDALPGRAFTGRVARIAPLPDAQNLFFNPDLKVYPTDIHIDGNGGALRTGMSCRAEIIVAQYDQATYIPVQAVLKVGGKPVVYVADKGEWKPRSVKLGLDNNRLAMVVEGLKPGEKVLLTPPLHSAEVEPYRSGPEAAEETLEESKPETSRKMSPEEQQKLREKWESMSPEERAALREGTGRQRGDSSSPQAGTSEP